MSKRPFQLKSELLAEDHRFCAGKATLKTVRLTVCFQEGEASFPLWLMVPNRTGSHPLFVHINFHPEMPTRYLPAEEIRDRGYAILAIEHNAVSPDAQDGFATGLGALLRKVARTDGISQSQLPGKIAIWAWVASRALDWALEQPEICSSRIAVIGHSRLGKAALLCGALDQRIACIIANASGCSGAAITRGKAGEHIADIVRSYPYWFCEAYQQYANKESALPFEQDWLLAVLAPRLLVIGDAVKDVWCDPVHEYLSCASAGKAREWLGEKGLIHPDRLPEVGETLHEGNIGYHLRNGEHYLSREDWNRYMNFLDARGWRT